jgi:hypothetical protein
MRYVFQKTKCKLAVVLLGFFTLGTQGGIAIPIIRKIDLSSYGAHIRSVNLSADGSTAVGIAEKNGIVGFYAHREDRFLFLPFPENVKPTKAS